MGGFTIRTIIDGEISHYIQMGEAILLGDFNASISYGKIEERHDDGMRRWRGKFHHTCHYRKRFHSKQMIYSATF